jgi:hypothetical protein
VLQSVHAAIAATILHVVQAFALAASAEMRAYCQLQIQLALPPRPTARARLPRLDSARAAHAPTLRELLAHPRRAAPRTRPAAPRRPAEARSRGSASDASNGAQSDAPQAPRFQPHEVFMLAARAAAIGGGARGFHAALRGALDEALAEIQRNTKGRCDAFHDELGRWLRRIQTVARPMLIIPKREVQMQTDPLPLVDEEVMTLAVRPFERKRSRA